MTQFFIGFFAVGQIAVAVIALGRFFHHTSRRPTYRHTKTYRTRDKRCEFTVLDIANFEDLGDFITFLVRMFKFRIPEEDRKLDDMVWVLGTAKDWIKIYYAITMAHGCARPESHKTTYSNNWKSFEGANALHYQIGKAYAKASISSRVRLPGTIVKGIGGAPKSSTNPPVAIELMRGPGSPFPTAAPKTKILILRSSTISC